MKTLTLQNDAQAVVVPLFEDTYGNSVAGPAGGTATSSDPSIFAASVNASGDVLVVPVAGATGTGTLTYTNGTLTDEASVVITAPAVVSVSLDVADAKITAQTAAGLTA